jgi:DNA-dependent metalloprotease WSS1
MLLDGLLLRVLGCFQGLNKNGGRGKTMEINVRLRYHHSPDAFYPYEDILGTMLHEITHNVRGPHDAQFYSILDELTEECEELMAKSITGTGIGFDGPSMGRLGSHSWIPHTIQRLRRYELHNSSVPLSPCL